MKTSEQRPKRSPRLIQAQRKDRSLSVKDNRPESAAQAQLLAAVRSGEPSPLVSLVGQGRAGHSPAMIQKKGVVQRWGWIMKKIECVHPKVTWKLYCWVNKEQKTGGILRSLLPKEVTIRCKIQGRKLELTCPEQKRSDLYPSNKVTNYIEEKKRQFILEYKVSLLSTYMLKDKPSDEIIELKNNDDFYNWITKGSTQKSIRNGNKITVKNTIFTAKGLLAEYAKEPKKNLQIGLNRNILTELPAEESSTLYFVRQGLFAVGTGKDFPGGFFTDSASPCVAIAIKCGNGIFALGHFDSDLNGNEGAYNVENIDNTIKRIYDLMVAKNNKSDNLGQVKVVLTRAYSRFLELYGIYERSIIKYFDNVKIQRRGVEGAYVSRNKISGFAGSRDVYTKSLEHKKPEDNSKFMKNLHSQSDLLNSDGANSLVESVTDLRLGNVGTANEVVGKNMAFAKNTLLKFKQEGLQHNIVENLKTLFTKINGELLSELKNLKNGTLNLSTLINRRDHISDTEIKNFQYDFDSVKALLTSIKEELSNLEAPMESLGNTDPAATEIKQKINTILAEADVALAEADVALAAAKPLAAAKTKANRMKKPLKEVKLSSKNRPKKK